MTQLTQKHCQPCEGKVKPYTKNEAEAQLKDVPSWKPASNYQSISRELVMKNFVAAVNLINKIKDVAESENHHPDLHLTGYKNLRIELSTHALGGLSENDFILAAKIDQLPMEIKK